MPGVKGRSGGHNAKTVKEHHLGGTFKKERHSGFTNPEPPAGAPRPPLTLKGEAKREWARMMTRLDASKILSTVDDGSLYQYCKLFAEVHGLQKKQEDAGKRVKTFETRLDELSGELLVEAYTTLRQLARDESAYTPQIRMGRMALLRYLTEFGLTPASRGRVKVAETKDPDDPFADLDDEDDAKTH